MTKEDIREEEFLDERGIGLPIMHKIVNERARKEKEVKKCNSSENRDQRQETKDFTETSILIHYIGYSSLRLEIR